MSPEATHKKLEFLINHLDLLVQYKNCSYEKYLEDHLKVDRLLEIMITAVTDIIYHLLAVKGEPTPTSYSSGILRAGEVGILPNELSRSLAKAAGMRNILAHGYDDIDPKKIHESINQAIQDFGKFIEATNR